MRPLGLAAAASLSACAPFDGAAFRDRLPAAWTDAELLTAERVWFSCALAVFDVAGRSPAPAAAWRPLAGMDGEHPEGLLHRALGRQGEGCWTEEIAAITGAPDAHRLPETSGRYRSVGAVHAVHLEAAGVVLVFEG